MQPPLQNSLSSTTKPTINPLPKLLVLLAAGSLSSATGAIVAPVFPEVITDLGVDPSWAGVLVSIHTLTTALASPALALLANRMGLLPIFVGSLVGYACFGVAGALMTNFWSMLAMRALTGAASGGIAAVSVGILSSMYEGDARTRMLGYATSALATATVIFPVLGGWIGSEHWQYAFYLHGFALPVALWALFVLGQQTSKSGTGLDLPQNSELLQSLRQSAVLLLLVGLAATSALSYVIIVYVPLHLKATLNATPLVSGGVLATQAIGAAVISAVGASRLARRIGSVPTIAIGFLLMAFSFLVLPPLRVPIQIVLAAVPFGIGFGLVMPNFYGALSNLSPATQRASLLAIGTGISSLGQFVSPLLFGPIWKSANEGIFTVAAALALMIGILLLCRERSR
jgi:MFS transporter, ACDE family, multidrug resistance protein